MICRVNSRGALHRPKIRRCSPWQWTPARLNINNSFYCASVCEPQNQCFVNHPREARKHRSTLWSQNMYGHTGTLIQMDKEQKGVCCVLPANNNEWFSGKMAAYQRDEGISKAISQLFNSIQNFGCRWSWTKAWYFSKISPPLNLTSLPVCISFI